VDKDAPFVLGFVGYADSATAQRAEAFEDQVLLLLGDHGARLLYRGRRALDEDEALPLEFHLIWFPHRRALDAYLADERRLALIREHGEVFRLKHAVRLESLIHLGGAPMA
jgi:hypothetical protein